MATCPTCPSRTSEKSSPFHDRICDHFSLYLCHDAAAKTGCGSGGNGHLDHWLSLRSPCCSSEQADGRGAGYHGPCRNRDGYDDVCPLMLIRSEEEIGFLNC